MAHATAVEALNWAAVSAYIGYMASFRAVETSSLFSYMVMVGLTNQCVVVRVVIPGQVYRPITVVTINPRLSRAWGVRHTRSLGVRVSRLSWAIGGARGLRHTRSLGVTVVAGGSR